jgi:hypothetical protein
MISGISSSGSHPNPFVQKVKTERSKETRPEEARSEVQQESELRAPQGDEKSLLREFRLFDLAFRELDRMLPRLELVNAAFD